MGRVSDELLRPGPLSLHVNYINSNLINSNLLNTIWQFLARGRAGRTTSDGSCSWRLQVQENILVETAVTRLSMLSQ